MTKQIKFDSCAISDKGSCCNSGSKAPEKIDIRKLWNNAYKQSTTETLGWYEAYPEQSLQLIQKCNLEKNARMLHIGTGTSTLIDELIKAGYRNIIANDISSEALQTLKNRLGKKAEAVEWVTDDLLNARYITQLKPVDLWHDRAVLHFFTEKKDQDSYFNLLKKTVKIGGYVLIAVFNKSGATRCSGLQVQRYDEVDIDNKLGAEFKLIAHFNYTYIMPSGEKRPYVYTLSKRS